MAIPPHIARLAPLFKIGAGVFGTGWLFYNSLYTVDGGQRGVVFNRLQGVKDEIYGEGTHLLIPWFEWPIIFDVRTRPKELPSLTGTRDLQYVNISLRVLYRPDTNKLPVILSKYGEDYDKRILPSIMNETLKAVVAQFNAEQLTTQREEVSRLIRRNLTERADDFHIRIDDCAITHLSFGREYSKAVEDKQVAQQEAERAKYLVDVAEQDRQSKIIAAQGEAEAAKMIGKAMKKNPAFAELRRIEKAREIATTIANSPNRVFLNSDALLVNLTSDFGIVNKKTE
jgi:prohibitin 2